MNRLGLIGPRPVGVGILPSIMVTQMEDMKWKVGHTLVYNRDEGLQKLTVAFWKPV